LTEFMNIAYDIHISHFQLTLNKLSRIAYENGMEVAYSRDKNNITVFSFWQ